MTENQNFKCTGNCLNCIPAQRAYCASQHAYSNMKVLDVMMGIVNGMNENIDKMKGTIEELKVKIEAIQNSEATVFDPTEEKSEIPNLHTPQSGDGGESRSPETNNH